MLSHSSIPALVHDDVHKSDVRQVVKGVGGNFHANVRTQILSETHTV
jgi:hypothetical protein